MINFAEKRRFMYRKKIPFDIDCGVKIAMEVIGGKWKSCIIQELDKGPKRPSELHRYFDDASPRVINQQLKELEIHGMIQKKIFSEQDMILYQFGFLIENELLCQLENVLKRG